MARRKARKTITRYIKKAKKRYKRGGLNPTKVIIPAMIYGAGRQYLSNMATPITSKIPAGNYADELLFGGIGYYLMKKNTMGMKNLGMAMLIVEGASVGNQLVGSVNNGSMGSGNVF